ncbi:MAG: hypothetical protein JOZ38_00910, partial [Candidatus Eremiobacteraeota bacterium]|nr:hypothetical protein [Candidatus Eremiobacteraeota bacterium]
FRLLTGGDSRALARHQSMRALIEWSYDLLVAPEQQLFRKLSIFAGGCTLEMAAAICGDGDELAVLDPLSSLVEKSLLQAEPSDAGPRYAMLESVRQYARERLVEEGEEPEAARAHAIAFAALGDEIARTYDTTPDSVWSAQVQSELENWRGALAWAFGMQGDVAIGQRLAGALLPVWRRYAAMEGRQWVRRALETCDADTDERIVAALELSEAAIAEGFYQYRSSYEAAERALAHYRHLGDARGILRAQTQIGFGYLFTGRSAEGEALLREALDSARSLGLPERAGWILVRLGLARALADDADGARVHYSEAQTIATAAANYRMSAEIKVELADLEFRSGDAPAAVRLVGDAIQDYRAHRDRGNLANGLSNGAAYLVALGRYDEARTFAREAVLLFRDLQREFILVIALQHVAAVAGLRPCGDAKLALEDRRRSAHLLGYADARLRNLEAHLEFTEQQEYDRLLFALRDALGDEERERLMAEGASWNEDRAVAEALLV